MGPVHRVDEDGGAVARQAEVDALFERIHQGVDVMVHPESDEAYDHARNEYVKQILWCWSELLEAMHGVNGHGGTIAEIYAYRLGEGGNAAPNPFAAETTSQRERRAKDLEAFELQASASFCAVVDLFEQTYDVIVVYALTKDGKDVSSERVLDHMASKPFAWRVNVRVVPRAEGAAAEDGVATFHRMEVVGP